jgi:hypothetical protein
MAPAGVELATLDDRTDRAVLARVRHPAAGSWTRTVRRSRRGRPAGGSNAPGTIDVTRRLAL